MTVFVQPCTSYDLARVRAAVGALRPLFAQTVRRGDRVTLKPNWLAHRHKHRADEWQSVITHPAIITAVLEIVLECLDGQGQVVITDAPQTDSSWSGIMARMDPAGWTRLGLERGIPVTVLDLREDEWTTIGDVNISRRKLPGDPLGSTEVDLGTASEFMSHRASARGYYGADYNLAETNAVHRDGTHRYRLSRTVISSDVFINLPKMKTHKKAGITCSLKNLVGINTYKNFLPHHTEGTLAEGGDQFPTSAMTRKLEGVLSNRFKAILWTHPSLGRWLVPIKFLGRKVFGETHEIVRSGNWYGNDTLWRMVLDLNKALLYANPDGTLRPDAPESRKRYLSVVDGVIAGEGNGPEAPDPKPCGVIVAGTNAVAVDAACARLMGLDWTRIPSLARAFEVRHFRLADFAYGDINIASPLPELAGPIEQIEATRTFAFRPHFGWAGHVELR